MTLLLTVVTIVIIQRLSELAVAKRNYSWAIQQGGVEHGAGHYWLFVALHSGWILAIIAECLIRKPALPSLWPLFLVLVLSAQILRYWALHTLGRYWNTRILTFAGTEPVKHGPYRYFRHPNYLAVVIEIGAIPALLGAWYTAVLFSVINGVLLLFVRIPAEEKAMDSARRQDC